MASPWPELLLRLRWSSCRKRASGHIGGVSGSTVTLRRLSRNANKRMIQTAPILRTGREGSPRGRQRGLSPRIEITWCGASARHRSVTGARTKRSQRIPPVPRRPPGASLLRRGSSGQSVRTVRSDRTNQADLAWFGLKSARPRTSAASRVGARTVPCQPVQRVARLPDPVRSSRRRSCASGARNVRRFTLADGINCELPHTISTSRRPGKSGGLWRHIGATRNGNLRPKTDKIAPRRLS